MQLLTGQDFASSGTISVFGHKPVENAEVLQKICIKGQRYPEDFKLSMSFEAPGFQNWDAGFADRLSKNFGCR
jgi:ABC-2 type transport system ATP-binding protein